MAAEWYYVANQQQTGPVELEALRGMLQTGSLSSGDLVFGPGLNEWTRAGLVPALAAVAIPMAQPAGTLGYQGLQTDNANLSTHAMDMLRQTKPWTRFISVMMFIGAGLMIVGGLLATLVGAVMSGRGAPPIPAAMGAVYLVMGAIYFAPALYLSRFASSVGEFMRGSRMRDLELALGAQKSFWKFMGIVTIIIMCIYAIVIVVAIGMSVLR